MLTPKIIFAGRDDATLFDLQSRLKGLGIDTFHVTTGFELVRLLRRFRVDMLVLDDQLDDISGPAAMGIIRELSPSVKVIMTVNANASELETHCRQLGLVFYTVKPADAHTLMDVIQHALAHGQTIA